MKKTVLLLLLCSGACNAASFHTSFHRQDRFADGLQDRFADGLLKAGLIGAGAAGLYGSYKLFNWLFTRTDERVITDVQHLLQKTEKYQAMDSLLLRYHVTSPVAHISESCLYDLGTEKIQDDYIDTYISNLYHLMRRLRNEKQELSNRMIELPSYSILYAQMNQLLHQVKSRLPRIELLHGVLKHNRNFYLLFELESDMIRDYSAELDILNTAYDEYNCTARLKRAVMSRNTNRFPYLHYINRLEKDMNRLDRTIQSISFAYPHRISAANDIKQALYTVKTILLATHEYHMELQIQQKEREERERLALQKEWAKLHAHYAAENALFYDPADYDDFSDTSLAFSVHFKR